MPDETQETLIEEETTSTTPGPVEEKQESEDLAARLAKVEEEKENYRKMALKYKEDAKPKTLETEEEVYPDWDEQSKKFQKQTIDLAQKAAESTTRQQVEKVNEKNAIAQFIDKNPRYADDSEWQGLLAKASIKSKESVQEIVESLGEADVLYRYKKGEFDKQPEKTFDVSDLATVGNTTSKSGVEGKSLTQSEINMAKMMRVDPKKLAEEDMSKPAEIQI